MPQPMPSPSTPPPGAARGVLEGAMGEASAAEMPMDAAPEMTEIESRIVRLEDKLIERGVLTDMDLSPGPEEGALPPEAPMPDTGAPPVPLT